MQRMSVTSLRDICSMRKTHAEGGRGIIDLFWKEIVYRGQFQVRNLGK
jgi:hypothetical protein